MKNAKLLVGALASFTALTLFTGCGTVKQSRAYIDGMYGYGYGFPLVMMEVTKDVVTATNRSGEYKAPMNQFGRIRTFVDPDFKDVVRISVSSLWSHGFIDLAQDAWVISQPDTQGRYIVVQGLNMWTDNFMSVGSRTTGTEAGNFLIVGPDWQGTPPPDIKQVFRCSTRYAWVLVQMSAGSPAEYSAVHALQDQLKMTPLRSWGQPYSPPHNVSIDATVDATATPFDQVRLMDGVTFFQRLSKALKDSPPYEADHAMLKKLKRLGVVPGEDFDASKVDPAVAQGMNKAAAKVFTLLGTAQYDMTTVNGWLIATNTGRFGTDYNTRAFMAFAGLGALTTDDCVYPTTFVDSEGRLLDGGSKYVIRFEKDKLPPTHSGVWSLSPYRENFYVRNSLERYGILSSMPLKYNADGSLDIYIQGKSPGADKESNWLPSPPSLPFNLSMRVYQPKKEIMDGPTKDNLIVGSSTYVIPPVRKIE